MNVRVILHRRVGLNLVEWKMGFPSGSPTPCQPSIVTLKQDLCPLSSYTPLHPSPVTVGSLQPSPREGSPRERMGSPPWRRRTYNPTREDMGTSSSFLFTLGLPLKTLDTCVMERPFVILRDRSRRGTIPRSETLVSPMSGMHGRGVCSGVE